MVSCRQQLPADCDANSRRISLSSAQVAPDDFDERRQIREETQCDAKALHSDTISHGFLESRVRVRDSQSVRRRDREQGEREFNENKKSSMSLASWCLRQEARSLMKIPRFYPRHALLAYPVT